MRALKLDFLHPLPRLHWASWVLLAAGLALAGWTGWQGEQARRALAEAVAAAPASVATAVPRRAAGRPASSEAGSTDAARAQLATPWGELFSRLEANRPARIALLALDADARKPDATLTAEARSVKDMLAWIELLKGEAGFRRVTLASHAVQEDDPQRPVRFVVRLEWRS